MILPITNVLTAHQVAQMREHLDQASWVDGAVTAGGQALSAKHNLQLSEQDPLARELGDAILTALARNPLFISAALPLKILPPMFNRYSDGGTYGLHVDNAIRVIPGTVTRVRTDLSATLFLAEPDEYEGGELEVEGKYGTQRVRLNAGDMILYPSTSLHRVTPVTQGARVAAFFWIQSMVRDHERREMLFDLDTSIQSLTGAEAEGQDLQRLTAIYHRLIQQWADT
ncbi:MAG: Fe2+-dependent dioxygenase [Oceanospirillaceae bacterium]|uniref:Fe2+-dependent dioxygenase n=1 Tax=Marinobacterium litorale TaxID=404770 RepID=UPI0003FFA5BB|nr:Fe2+-dependent dioxygenase [Marinobacterium litorale]MBT00378.1 Fe2+-dependent dioxygenase [Oceanospirillaceae bacterium]